MRLTSYIQWIHNAARSASGPRYNSETTVRLRALSVLGNEVNKLNLSFDFLLAQSEVMFKRGSDSHRAQPQLQQLSQEICQGIVHFRTFLATTSL
jgi:hypothetical protein